MHRKLFDLASANSGKGAGLRSEASGDGETATIYVYDVIDPYWGVSAAALAKALAGITAPAIDLRINSPGGDVFEGRAMQSLLVGSGKTITTRIDGLAASAASVLALAGGNVQIAEGGFFMIHKGWTWMMGDADDFRDAAGLLDKVDGAIVESYCAKTGKTAEDVLAWMSAETWFTAQEAIDAGFCDAVMPTVAATAAAAGAAQAKARAFNLAVYDHAPTALTEAASPPEQTEIDETTRQRALARLGLYERTA